MPNTEETAALLAQVPMLSGLEPRELEQLAQVAVPRRYERGEMIFQEGDSGDTCYVISSGSVSVTRKHADGRTIALAELRPGAIFGELAMFDGENRSATVEALEPTSAVALLAGDVQRLLRDRPGIAVKMLAGLADRLRSANERIAQQSFQTVSGRVASVLLSKVEARQAEGAGPEVLIEATQAEIAQLAGSSRESASRFLATLERAGVVTLGRGKVTVHDPGALGNYIH
jgi:CRP/FNR family cyclic AMP-dependent transcriptional regulator